MSDFFLDTKMDWNIKEDYFAWLKDNGIIPSYSSNQKYR